MPAFVSPHSAHSSLATASDGAKSARLGRQFRVMVRRDAAVAAEPRKPHRVAGVLRACGCADALLSHALGDQAEGRGATMDLQLKGKKAIVTGASRGIGRAIAETLAAEGCDVAICARGQAGVDEVVGALKAKGVTAFGAAVDIADGPALKNWITEAAQRLGGLDVLVSNASALTRGASEEDWQRMYDVDLMGAVRALEAARPFLEKAGAEH